MYSYEEKAKLASLDSYDTIEPDTQNDMLENDVMLSTEREMNKNNDTSIEKNEYNFPLFQKYILCFKGLTLQLESFIDKLQIEPNYKLFFLFLGAGVMFMVLSLMLLPVFIITPTKFVLTFGIGNILLLMSFVFYLGGKVFFSTILSDNRKCLTFSFFASILFGIIFAWRKFFFISIFFAFYQIIALTFFVLTFIPGGTAGILVIKSFLYSMLTSLIEPLKSRLTSNKQETTD